MAEIPIPPPPPPPRNLTPRRPTTSPLTHNVAQSTPLIPFLITGTTRDEKMFEFANPPERVGSVALRAVVRQYLSSPHLQTFQASQLHMIMGRLRCLHYTIDKYNDGVAEPTPIFLQYWRQRALNLMSGFGFQITHPEQIISITGLEELIQAMDELYGEEISNNQSLIQGGLITFEALGELYRPDTPIQGRTLLGGTPGVFIVVDSYYEEHRALIGMQKSFHWTMEFVATMGDHFTVVNFTEVLSAWMGVRARPLSELTYVPLDPSERPGLQKRGETYIQSAVGGAKFLAYSPNAFFLHATPTRQAMSRSSGSQLPSGGRIMIDAARGALLGHQASQGYDEPTLAMINLAGRYRQWRNAHSTSGTSQDALILWDTVPPEFAIYCWPALVGFSFTAKAWGHVLVAGLEPIKFHDEAFDRLVLAEERKQLIRALVRFGTDPSTDDIVGGKRGGSIFLLHGPPGVGKTLTAEAIAEVLHRPLYYVTMGELGMAPEDIERRLSDVLELCAEWDALVLLDEADVFLEQRSTSDIVRNSIVCVMLRLLEYHPGILFLTTNRVRTFDPAFESRVTIALRYETLAPDSRVQIWKNLLSRVSIPVSPDIDHQELGKHVLNGRQIKNGVRLAVALAREQKSPALTQEILEKTLHLTSLGRADMAGDGS